MSTRRLVVLVGLALLVGGLILGFMPRTASGVSCGSAFKESRDAHVADLTDAIIADNGGPLVSRDLTGRCEDARSTTRIGAFALIGVGAVVSIGGLAVVGQPARPEQTEQTEG